MISVSTIPAELINSVSTLEQIQTDITTLGTTVTTVQTDITGLDTRLSSVELVSVEDHDALSLHSDRLDSIDETIEINSDDIDILQNSVLTQGTRLSTAESNIVANSSAITIANGNISSLGSRVTTLETSSSSASSAITTLTGRVNTAESDITSIEGDISTMQDDIDSLEISVAALSGEDGNIGDIITEIQDDISTLQSDLNTAEATILTHTGNISTLSSSLTTAQGNISTLQSNVTTAQGNISTIQSNITTIQGNIASNDNDISALQTDVTTIETDVAAIEADITGIEGNISTLQTDLGTAESNITSLQGSVSTINSDITAIEGDVATAEANITTLQGINAGSRLTALEGIDADNRLDTVEALTSSLTVDVASIVDNKLMYVNVRDLGCIPMHEAGGLTIDNALLINDFLSGGFVDKKCAGLYFPGGGWGIKTPIEIPSIEGFAFYGDGVGDIRGELSYNDADEIGGLPSRIVGTAPNLECLIKTYGIFLHVQGVMFQGWYHNLRDDGANGVLREESNYAAIGIKIMPRYSDASSGIGTGKFTSPNLVVCCCDVAIECGDTGASNEDNADQFQLGRLNTPACSTGFHALNLQSVGHLIGQYEGNLCDTMFDFDRGGKLTVLQATLIESGGTLIKTRTNGTNEGIFHFVDLWVDAGAGNTCKIWESRAPLGADQETLSELKIDHLMLDAAYSGGPLFTMRGYNSLTISGSNKLTQTLVKVSGGSATFHPVIFINGARFNDGFDLDLLIDSGTSSGYADVFAFACRSYIGNGGFKHASYSWNGGTITRRPLPVLMGGTGGSTAAEARASLEAGVVIRGSIAIGNPSASTTYRGVGGDTGFTSAAEHPVRTITIPKSKTIKAVYFRSHAFGTTASSTGGTLSLRLNETSNTTITSTFNASGTNNNTSLSLSVAAGDRIAFQLDTPAWVTAPTTVYADYTIYME